MTDKDVKFEQLPDYVASYADNLLLQFGETNARLIFYQDMVEVNQEDDDIVRNQKRKRLKFEIKIPHRALKQLARISLDVMNANDSMLEATTGKNDDATTSAWWQYNKLLESTYYDTENYWLSNKDYEKLFEASKSLGLELEHSMPKKNNQNDSTQ
jgi:hypothetical protein